MTPNALLARPRGGSVVVVDPLAAMSIRKALCVECGTPIMAMAGRSWWHRATGLTRCGTEAAR